MAAILLIDDEPRLRIQLRAVLEHAGHTVVEAATGREGATRYRQAPVDLVITDLHMPELGRLDWLLELTGEFLNAKVMAISTTQGEDMGAVKVAKLLGARQILQRPFSLDTFHAAVAYELAH